MSDLDLSTALVPYPVSQRSPRTRNISCNQENIPPRPLRPLSLPRRSRHHSQPLTLSVSYYYQQSHNFVLRARGVVMDHNYSNNFGQSAPFNFNRSGNANYGQLPNGYIPPPYLLIAPGPTQSGGGNYSQQHQQSQTQAHPQQQPNYGMDQNQQQPQNYYPQNMHQAPNVNHYHGSNFNFFFGGAGAYDLNLRMQGMQGNQNQNYGEIPYQQEMGGQHYSQQGFGNPHAQHHGSQTSAGPNYAVQGNRHSGTGTVIRPTELSPPPPGQTLAYLPSSASSIPYDLRRSCSVATLATNSSNETGYQDEPEELYFSQGHNQPPPTRK